MEFKLKTPHFRKQGFAAADQEKSPPPRRRIKAKMRAYQKEEGNTTPILINKHGFSAALGRRAGQDVEAERPAVHKILKTVPQRGKKRPGEAEAAFFKFLLTLFQNCMYTNLCVAKTPEKRCCGCRSGGAVEQVRPPRAADFCKEVFPNGNQENVSAQEAAPLQGPRLPQENGDCQRP
jgi:hypothetical protein